MKTNSGNTIRCAAFLSFFSISSLFSQSPNINLTHDTPRDTLLKIAHAIIDSARCRVLVTVDENGKPHAREMDPFEPEKNMVIWLGTNPHTRKIRQIEKNPNVVMFYYDTKGLGYVSIEGTARLVDDPAEKTRHWKEYWTRYYADRDKDYILIQIIPSRLEVVSYKHKLFWKTDSFLPHSVEFDAGHIRPR
jgi:general stress protein 26